MFQCIGFVSFPLEYRVSKALFETVVAFCERVCFSYMIPTFFSLSHSSSTFATPRNVCLSHTQLKIV